MISVRRRAFLQLTGAAAIGTSVLPQLSASAVESTRQGQIAVRVFPTYSSAVYGNHNAVLNRLGELGVKRMSHRLTPKMPRAAIEFTQRAFHQYGIKSWLTVGLPNVVLTPAQWDDIEAMLRDPLAGMVELASGYNEPNKGGPTDWPARSVAHNRELFRRLSGVVPQIGTPQLWSGSLDAHDRDVAKLKAAGLAGSFNTIAWHLYPRGGVGESLIKRFESVYFGAFGRHPVVCTEAGYATPDPTAYTGGAVIVSETQQADLVPRLVEAYVARGYGLSYFELLNDPDPTGGNREAHLGLWRTPTLDPATWTPKPAVAAFRNKIASYAVGV